MAKKSKQSEEELKIPREESKVEQQPQEVKIEQKEKTAKNVSQVRAEILIAALEKQKTDMVPINAFGRKSPAMEKGNNTLLKQNPMGITGLNALIAAAHADQVGAKTNVYTTYRNATARGEAVRRGEHGFPIQLELWSEYVNKNNPEEKISQKDFTSLDKESRKAYRPDKKMTTMFVHNIDQTTMHHVHEEEYKKILSEYGRDEDRKEVAPEIDLKKEDKDLRIEVNQRILYVRDNLVAVTRDNNISAAKYDSQNDKVRIPPQNKYASYEEYVQDFFRNVAKATGNPGRMNRPGNSLNSKNDDILHEELVVELVSASKMVELGLPASVSGNNHALITTWQGMLKEEGYIDKLTNDVNKTLAMISKAESGQKIEMRQSVLQSLEQKFQEEISNIKLPEKFEKINMLQDDEKNWVMFIKPEGEPGFAIKPSYEDASLYFGKLKGQTQSEETEKFRNEMARKYYVEATKDPSKKIDLFKSNAPQEVIDKIDRAIVFKTKETEKESSKILIQPQLTTGEKLKPKLVSQDQWMRMWLAPDMKDYKKHLAAGMFSDEIKEIIAKEKQEVKAEEKAKVEEKAQAEKKKEEEKKNSPEQKEKEKKEQEAKEKELKAENKVVTAIAMSPMLKQFIDLKKKHPDALLLFRCGDFYETYQKDAEKASKILGITLTKSSKTKDQDGKPLAMAGFPYHALDTYLPKLIRAGERVAICDQIEAPKQTTKRGITELVKPGTDKDNSLEAKAEEENKKMESSQQEAEDDIEEEEEQTRSRSFHR